MSPTLAERVGQGHWPLMPTKARLYPSGAAFTQPIFQLYVLSIGLGFVVAAALVAVVLIVEHAVKGGVLLVLVDVTIFVELEDEEVVRELVVTCELVEDVVDWALLDVVDVDTDDSL
jgi:membrane-anchored protein YejM (alkaline phosphatase superfamily)